MSTPASICCRTISATARRTRASNAAGSGAVPASSASSVAVRSWARGRLPVCVVRMRSVLSFIVVCLLKPGHDLPDVEHGDHTLGLGFLVPMGEVPEIRVPAADLDAAEPVRDG